MGGAPSWSSWWHGQRPVHPSRRVRTMSWSSSTAGMNHHRLIDGLRDDILEAARAAWHRGHRRRCTMDVAGRCPLMFLRGRRAIPGLNPARHLPPRGATISGTGAEVSMTAVLTGPREEARPEVRLDHLRPDRVGPRPCQPPCPPTSGSTGMDTYIHSVEASPAQRRTPSPRLTANPWRCAGGVPAPRTQRPQRATSC